MRDATHRSADHAAAGVDRQARALSPSRRALFAHTSAAALAAMFGGVIGGTASATPRRTRTSAAGDIALRTTFRGQPLPIIDVYQAAVDPPLIGIDFFAVDDPDTPIHRLMHSGTLTTELTERIQLFDGFDFKPSLINRFSAILRRLRLAESALPDTVEGDQSGAGFVLILVLFILLVIIGAGFGLRYPPPRGDFDR